MTNGNRYQQYLETEVYSASPVGLVRLLLRAAVDALEAANLAVAAGDVATRTRAASKAYAIVAELMNSLDTERGGKVAGDLRELYVYVLGRVGEGSLNAEAKAFTEVAGLLNTLQEGWTQVDAPAWHSEVEEPARPLGVCEF